MRRTVTTLGLALALPLAAACSDDGPVAPEDGLGIEGIVENEIVAAADLADLSDEERAAVREILRTARESLRMLREAVRKGNVSLDQARVRARMIHDDTLAALAGIVGDGALARVLQRRAGGPDREAPGLALTERQRREIRALRQEMRVFVERVRQAVLAGEMTASEGRNLVRRKGAETRAAVCEILTREQASGIVFCRAR